MAAVTPFQAVPAPAPNQRARTRWHATDSGGIEPRLAALAHAGGALRCALAALAGAFVGRRGWEALGFARAGDYTRERLGLSARELRDLAWVDVRLRELPALERALVAGTLPWSKVRLLCRVATPADEGAWIARARMLACGALEREVRNASLAASTVAAGGDGDDEDEREPSEVLSIECSPEVRAKWWRACELARREAGARLSAGACAEVIAAEVLSAVPAQTPAQGLSGAGDRRPGERDLGPAGLRICAASERENESRSLELPDVVAPPEGRVRAIEALVDGVHDLTAAQLDTRLRRAMALDQQRLAEMAELLSRVRFDGLYRDLGFRTFEAYARERLGLRAGRVRTLLRLAGAMGLSPAFRHAFREREVALGQALALVPLVWEDASFPCRKAWIARARLVTVRRLEDDVAWALAHGKLDPDALPTLPESPTGEDAPALEPPAGRWICAAPPTAHVRFGAEVSVARLFRSALLAVRGRLACEAGPGDALEVMLDYVIGLRTEPKVRREHRVFARDGWRCTAPGCTSYRNLHSHHIRFRSRGGGDELANQITLCAWHHLRGVHQGRLEVSGRAPEQLRYRTTLGEWAAGDRVVHAQPAPRAAVSLREPVLKCGPCDTRSPW